MFKKIGANLKNIVLLVEKQISSYPKVTGGEEYLSKTSSKALQEAVAISKKNGDEFASLEYILLGILNTKAPVSDILS